MLTLNRQDDVRAVLADPRFAVPPPSDTPDAPDTHEPTVGIGWLRAHVARFSTGADHERRRAMATAELDRMDPATLRQRARERAATSLSTADDHEELAQAVTVGVLAEAMGVGTPVWREVAVVARAYHPGSDAGPEADDAVTHLIKTFGGTPDVATAARIGLLVQACAATAGLICRAVHAQPDRRPSDRPDDILAEALRDDPPVRVTRRIAVAPARVGETEVAAGTLVVLDIANANLPFGAGPRSCPGREHALAIAAGVVEALSQR